MSVDVQQAPSGAVSADAGCGGLVGRECWVPGAGAVGTVESVLPDGAVRVALSGQRAVTVERDAMVLLPQVGERVEMDVAGAPLYGLWVGLAGPPAAVERLAGVRLLVGGQLVERTVPAELVRAERCVTAPAGEPAVTGVLEVLAGAVAVADVERGEVQDWKQRLAAAACEHADDQGWCSSFDDFMVEWGLPARSRWFDVEIEVAGRVTVRVEAATTDAAEAQVTFAAVREAAADQIDGMDYQIKDTTAA